jgi:hypothetical protein
MKESNEANAQSNVDDAVVKIDEWLIAQQREGAEKFRDKMLSLTKLPLAVALRVLVIAGMGWGAWPRTALRKAGLPILLFSRLAASAKRHRRTKTAQLVMALEQFLDADEAQITPAAQGKPAKGKGTRS